ncbi:hypothetical protein [Bifidobacterium saguinibicoloris]|uniref:hypothetical protein n=1 Tax=Bifidobacterium saguinibicoloris TaxID=2834433 RepID=UPI001C5A09BE|nr:hypothetical protein [Bifidobacterium saguinibicoloris]MBW3080933.1 hypothetical protein [Bifidobacterium saguinibicoloris]
MQMLHDGAFPRARLVLAVTGVFVVDTQYTARSGERPCVDVQVVFDLAKRALHDSWTFPESGSVWRGRSKNMGWNTRYLRFAEPNTRLGTIESGV